MAKDDKTSKVSATAEMTVRIVCPECGKAIEVAIEGLSSYSKEVNDG